MDDSKSPQPRGTYGLMEQYINELETRNADLERWAKIQTDRATLAEYERDRFHKELAVLRAYARPRRYRSRRALPRPAGGPRCLSP